LAAIKGSIDVLTYCENAALRDDKELALLSIENVDTFPISCLSESLRADFDVALAAIRKNFNSVNFLNPEILKSREIVLERAKGGTKLSELPEQFWDDDEVVAAAMTVTYEVTYARTYSTYD
jgi:hypothetical protein